jgi:hypothetical protein
LVVRPKEFDHQVPEVGAIIEHRRQWKEQKLEHKKHSKQLVLTIQIGRNLHCQHL